MHCAPPATALARGATLLAVIGAAACSPPRARRARPPATRPADVASPRADTADEGAPTSQDPDGNDDHEEIGVGALPAAMVAVSMGRAPGGLHRICDLTAFRGSLYTAGADEPLNRDGAVVGRYTPGADAPWSVAFNWNRPGQPTRGGGAGQGFLRVRAIGDRLYVPDTDPPYNGFGVSETGTEGYVFASDWEGRFATPRGPTLRVPGPPDEAGYFGAGVVPRAYHVIDVARFRGALYASTGSVPPRERAWEGPMPGALHRADARGRRWTYAVDYPRPWRPGVWRLTYLTRFRGALYAGIQDNDGRERYDYVRIAPPPDVREVAQEHVEAFRHPESGGGSLTLRWYTDRGRLFWITYERHGVIALRVSDDGLRWRDVTLPDEGGWPTDVTRFRDGLVVLATGGLYRLAEPPESAPATRLATTPPREVHAFEASNGYCTAPLAVLDDRLYAGSQREGRLYRFDPAPREAPAP